MSGESSFLSQTLQSITTTKMREQDKRRHTFEARKAKILKEATESSDDRARLGVLLSGFKSLSSSNKGVQYVDEDRNNVVRNIRRHLEQSYRDPSVSSSLLRGFEDNLLQKLDQESQRFNFADLYYRLLTEWTDPQSRPIVESERKEDDLEGSFEHVQRYTLENLKNKFSDVVFTPLETNAEDIGAYLNSLFEDDYATSLLEDIRSSVARFAENFKARSSPFDGTMLKLCIEALLTNDLLNDDAKMTLSEFSSNTVVLDEIADVLNLRFSDLDNWSWDAEDGMYYEPRRQPNGKYRIMMDQDILQALFLHYIAISWCDGFKKQFRQLPSDPKFWRGPKEMTADEQARRHYFTGMKPEPEAGINQEFKTVFTEKFLLSSLPSTLNDNSDPYGEYQENKDAEDGITTGLGIRQLLLQQIATGLLIRRGFHQDVAVVQSDLQWYATGLPHSTLWAVLRFWGMPEDWITFFKKFAEAPLRMSATPGENVRTRRRGIPITDAFEKLFGECVLFSMDVAVNRLSGMTLIRFHDDIWLSGEPAQCASAWETIEGFVKVHGLDINTSKTGSVYLPAGDKDEELAKKFPKGPVCMGMLQLTDNGDWAIDQKQVAAHVRQLHKQLGQSTSIIAWVQTWNACMGTFFQNTFGTPANCFGQAHVDSILETHANMQRELFESHNGSVTECLREQVLERFGVDKVPDSFFFLPEELGGLGLQNPFIPFLVLRDQLVEDPVKQVDEFLQREKSEYKEASELFAACAEADKRRHFKEVFEGSPKHAPIYEEPYFSFEEYTKNREMYSFELGCTYRGLMRKPQVMDVQLNNEIKPWFEELTHSHSMGWKNLSSENKWIMHLYAQELKQRFGALSIVDRNLLPSGVMTMLRKKKITWQLILWE